VVEKLVDKGTAAESVLTEEEKTKLKELFEQTLNDKKLNISIGIAARGRTARDHHPQRIHAPHEGYVAATAGAA
jgi:hypothetical protein